MPFKNLLSQFAQHCQHLPYKNEQPSVMFTARRHSRVLQNLLLYYTKTCPSFRTYARHLHLSLFSGAESKYNWGFWAAINPAASAKLGVIINSPHENPDQWLPCFPHRLKHNNGVKDCSIPNKTFKTGHGSRSLVTRSIGCNPMRQITLISMVESDSNHRAFHRSTHRGQIESLIGKG